LSPESGKEKAAPTKGEREGEQAGRSRMVVFVRDLSCVTCRLAIEKQVKKINGVKDVRIAMILNKVFIDYDPKLVDSNAIRKAIEKTGYKSYRVLKEQER